jgi:hypothetical protein
VLFESRCRHIVTSGPDEVCRLLLFRSDSLFMQRPYYKKDFDNIHALFRHMACKFLHRDGGSNREISKEFSSRRDNSSPSLSLRMNA